MKKNISRLDCLIISKDWEEIKKHSPWCDLVNCVKDKCLFGEKKLVFKVRCFNKPTVKRIYFIPTGDNEKLKELKELKSFFCSAWMGNYKILEIVKPIKTDEQETLSDYQHYQRQLNSAND